MTDMNTPEIADTVRWLERAVIGLNLCPFAKAPHVKGQIHCVLSEAKGLEGLRDELIEQLQALAAMPAEERETVLLIVPQMLQDFLEFNDFLDEADAVLQELDLEGVFQVASFHPQFQFADTEPDDIGNFTNRSPYPTLHLLREESIDRAVEAFPEAEMIYETNIETLEKLGTEGWKKLDVGPKPGHSDVLSRVSFGSAPPMKLLPSLMRTPVARLLRETNHEFLPSCGRKHGCNGTIVSSGSMDTCRPNLVRPGQSVELLKELHILTREGKLNQDSRRKLKQVYHLFQFIDKLLKELPASDTGPTLADHGAGKSYLGFIIYDLFFKALGQGTIYGIETRSELVESSQALAQRLGFERMQLSST
jgi:uncharacterized protein